MAFPTTPILDNFNRADGSIGSNWDITPGGETNITSNAVLIDDTTDSSINNIWNQDTFGVDQEAYMTLVDLTVSAPGVSASLILKYQDNSNFLLVVYRHAENHVEVYRTDAGTFTSLGQTAATLSDGDRIGVSVVGNTLAIYVNESEFTTRDVSEYGSIDLTGKIGFRYFITGTDTETIDDFGGGTYSPSSISIPVLYHQLQQQGIS